MIWLNNDRTYSITNFRSSHKSEIQHNKALYIIQPKAVKLREEKGGYKQAEIFYFQANALPIPAAQGEDKITSNAYLDSFVLNNALQQTGDPRILEGGPGSFLKWPQVTIQNILKLFIFGVIGYALLRGYVIG